MSSLFDNPNEYLDSLLITGNNKNDVLLNRLKSIIVQTLSEMESAMPRDREKLANTLEKLWKVWALATGNITDRRESIIESKETLTIRHIIEKEGSESLGALDVLDYKVFEAIEDGS